MIKILLSRTSFWLGVGGGLIALLLLVTSTKSKQMPTPEVGPPHKPGATEISATGVVEAFGENVNVSPSLAGVVTEVLVEVGRKVKKGDPLFRMDSRLAEANVKIALANLAVAQAELQELKQQLNRLNAVSNPRAVSEEELENAKNGVLVGQAKVDASRASLDERKTQVELLTVSSPQDASVLQVNIRPGEFTQPGGPVPMVLGDVDNIQIRADVDEELVSKLPNNPNAIAYVRGENDNPIKLDFLRVDPLIVPKTALTGSSTERIDTRVVQVIFKASHVPENLPVYIGQQVDVFITP